LIHRRLHADIADNECQLNRKKTFWQTLSHHRMAAIIRATSSGHLGIHIDNQSALHFTSQNISPS
jgi:hypothetical protein